MLHMHMEQLTWMLVILEVSMILIPSLYLHGLSGWPDSGQILGQSDEAIKLPIAEELEDYMQQLCSLSMSAESIIL